MHSAVPDRVCAQHPAQVHADFGKPESASVMLADLHEDVAQSEKPLVSGNRDTPQFPEGTNIAFALAWPDRDHGVWEARWAAQNQAV